MISLARGTRRLVAATAIAATASAILPAMAAVGRTDPTGSITTPRLDPSLATAVTDPTDLLSVFVHGTDIAAAVEGIDAAGLAMIERYDRVGIAVAAGTPAQVEVLRAQPGITYVENADLPIDLALDTSHRATRGAEVIEGFDVVTTSDVERQVTVPDQLANGKPHPTKTHTETVVETVETVETHRYDGSGVSIAIVDSGVEADHPFFQRPDGTSKVVRNLEFVCSDIVTVVGDDAGQPCLIDSPTPNSDTTSAGGHGTHVAGIAAGMITELSDGRTIMGAAPGADLVALSVGAGLNITGGTSALYWVLTHHADPCGDGSCAPIKVVNNSWGIDPGAYDPESAVGKISDALVADGVVVAFAASNDGGDGSANMVSPYAQNPTPGVLNVANYDDGATGTRDGSLSPDSSRGKEGQVQTYPDISAPGSNILSSCRPYLPVCSTGFVGGEVVEDGDYNTISGTSMATPHIAGIVAQLFEANPDLTPGEIEDVLEDTAYKFGFGGEYEPDLADRNSDDTTSYDKGHGLVDVVAAVSRAIGVEGPDAESTCTADGPLAIDGLGDASENGVLPNEPSLDLTEGRAAWDPVKAELTVTIRVADLSSDPGVPIAHRATFSFGGHTLFVLSDVDRAAATTTFEYGYVGTISQTVLADLVGSIDEASNTITITLTNADIARANPEFEADGVAPVPAMADGDVLRSWVFTANRRYDAVAVSYNPPADTAEGPCPYTLGLGAVAPPVSDDDGGQPANDPVAPPSGTSYDGIVGLDGSIEWTGEAPLLPAYPQAGAPEVGNCLGGADDPNCDYFTLWVSQRGQLVITTTFADGDDWDTWLFDEDGAQIGQAATAENPEVITVALQPGLYRFAAAPFMVTAGYGATATLRAVS